MREVSAVVEHWSGPSLVKVASPASFAAGACSLERTILDAREPNALIAALISLPWAGVLTDSANFTHVKSRIVVDRETDLRPGDVLEVRTGRRRLPVIYRPGEVGNVLFATERCNNFCLMCSQPPRDVDDDFRVGLMHELIDLVDPEEPSLGLSGGEPTLLGPALVDVLQHCAEALPRTHVQVLTNGRRFAADGFADQFEALHPSLMWAVPLYGDTYRLHDYVVQAGGAFAETIRGLYALHKAGQRIEVRIVLVRPTVERLPAIARFIQRNLPFVEHIALMGTEPIGFAKAQHSALWVDPVDSVPALEAAIESLAGYGMAVSLYNLPLCVLPRPMWRYAQRSISEWKQGYLPACEGCAVRSRCGGFFQWITPQWTSRAISPVVAGENHA